MSPKFFLLAWLAVTPCSLAADLDATSKREITRLIDHLAASGCQFNRNGSWYGAARAVEHLKAKYDYLRKRNLIRSTEDFIQHAASESNASGKPYLVKCGAAQQVPSAAWFREVLAEQRSAPGTAAAAHD